MSRRMLVVFVVAWVAVAALAAFWLAAMGTATRCGSSWASPSDR